MANRSRLDKARTQLLRSIRTCERARGACSPARIERWAAEVERLARIAEHKTHVPARARALGDEQRLARNLRIALADPDRALTGRIREIAMSVQRAPLPQNIGLEISGHYVPAPLESMGLRTYIDGVEQRATPTRTLDPFMPEADYANVFGDPSEVRGVLLTEMETGRPTWIEFDKRASDWADFYSVMRAYYSLSGKWLAYLWA